MIATTFVRLSRAEKQTIRELLEYIDGHYAEKLTADGLAEQFCLPIKKMRAAVRANTGRQLHEHIEWVRLEAAKTLILENEPIKIIAGAIGYKQASQFCVFFKRHTGQTPAEFRNAHGGT